MQNADVDYSFKMIELFDKRIKWIPVSADEEVEDGILIDGEKRDIFLKEIGIDWEDLQRYIEQKQSISFFLKNKFRVGKQKSI